MFCLSLYPNQLALIKIQKNKKIKKYLINKKIKMNHLKCLLLNQNKNKLQIENTEVVRGIKKTLTNLEMMINNPNNQIINKND